MSYLCQVKLNEAENTLGERDVDLKEIKIQLKTKELEIIQLSSELTVTTTKFAAADEENKLLTKDLRHKNLTEDEQIRRDMNIRNEAVKEKNKAWIELSQTKVGPDGY